MIRRRHRPVFALSGLALVLLTAVAPAVGEPSAAAEPIIPRIVGGSEVDPPGEYPFVVALVEASNQDEFAGLRCGGALIGAEWVLTAGHCTSGGAAEIDVLVGRTDLADDGQGERIGVAVVYRHPAYSYPANDLALLRLERAAALGAPIALAAPADAALYATGATATVAGWGLTMEKPPGTPDRPAKLREVNLPIVADADCAEVYGDSYLAASMLCAGDLVLGGVDACPGDSGGPLFVAGPTGYLHVGIVSGGNNPDECGLVGEPALYTETAAFHAWITSTLSDPPPPPPYSYTCQGRPATMAGTPGDDPIVGTGANDVIVALGGDDEVWGNGGQDLICLGPGNDRAYGGADGDTILGQGGADYLEGNADADTLDGGTGRDTLIGGDGDDLLLGRRGADTLHGLAGDDRLLGGAGDDTLAGGEDDDRLLGGLGVDVLRGGTGPNTCRGGEDVVC